MKNFSTDSTGDCCCFCFLGGILWPWQKQIALHGTREEQCMENHVADQIRFYRRQEGLTQEQLAEAMGVSVAAVSKWEQGGSLR